MDAQTLIGLLLIVTAAAILLSVIAGWLSQQACPHVWKSRGIYGDERLLTGHTKEWTCIGCGKHTFKDPTK